MFTADEETRTFTNDGRKVVSVSNVLDLYFPFPVQFLPADAAINGTVRHEFYNFIAQHPDQELEDPDPRIAGSIASFRRFISEVKPVYVSGEVRYFDSVLGICGKPDLVAIISGRLAVLDYKPESKNKRTIAQTAAYAVMLRRNGVNVLDRYALRLYDDGKYRLDAHKDDGDLRRWPALVAGYMAATFYK